MSSDELIREVDEDLQRETMLRLTRRWAPLIAAVLIAAVAGTLGWVLWTRHEASQRQDLAARIAAAGELLSERKPADAARAFAEIADEASLGAGAVARFRAAQAQIVDGSPRAAIDQLDRLAGQADADPILRDLATITSVQLQIDDGAPEVLQGRLAALAQPGAVWRNQADELLAILAVRQGQHDKAAEILQRIADAAGVPDELRRRVSLLRDAVLHAKGS